MKTVLRISLEFLESFGVLSKYKYVSAEPIFIFRNLKKFVYIKLHKLHGNIQEISTISFIPAFISSYRTVFGLGAVSS